MNAKRTLNLKLTEREMAALAELAEKQDLSKTAILRRALHLYQSVVTRIEAGEKLVFENEATNKKSELMVL